MGVQPGIPDVMMICGNADIAIEFKRAGEKPTDAQKAILAKFHLGGWDTAVVESCEEAKKFVREHTSIRDGDGT